MIFFSLDKKKPANGQRCVIKEKTNGGRSIDVFSQPQFFYDDCGFAHHPLVVSWVPVPKHVTENPVGWLSEYHGDALPPNNCECFVCEGKSRSVKYAYFIADKQKFFGCDDVIAFMRI